MGVRLRIQILYRFLLALKNIRLKKKFTTVKKKKYIKKL